jgi:hypothetical protein
VFESLLRQWRHSRSERARGAAFVETLFHEPDEADVRWLATNGTGGDEDHARWELRYARRAMGMITAQRDALDDRTASVVAHAMDEAIGRDTSVARGKLSVAKSQLNARLAGYSDALSNREGAGTGWHLGRTLLRFAGRREAVAPDAVAEAGALLARYLAEANAALRENFGAASLPDHVTPSALNRQ